MSLKSAVSRVAYFLLCIFIAFLIAISNVSCGKSDNFNSLPELITSYNPQHYAKITTDGNSIFIEGRFYPSTLSRIQLTPSNLHSDPQVNSNGEFTAALTSTARNGEYSLDFTLDNGDTFYYRIFRQNGQWILPNYSMIEQNRTQLDAIIEIDKDITASYIADDINSTNNILDAVENLSNEICVDAKTDYEKALAISQWVSSNIYYDFDASEDSVTLSNITLDNIISNRRTVCAGFANIYAALCNAQGLDVINIRGGTIQRNISHSKLEESSERHEWNAVWIDERWVFVDTTWNTQNTYSGGEYRDGSTNLKFFDISIEAISADHRFDLVERREYY